jgi:hypothetical protein
VENMRKSLKIATVAVVLFLGIAAAVLVFANSQNALATDDDQQTALPNTQTFFEQNNVTGPCRMRNREEMRADGFGSVPAFFENATLSTVEGSVVSVLRGMLILDTGSGQVRVMVPKAWTIGNQVVNTVGLFNGTFVSPGQTLTVKVLKADVFSNTSFSVNVMLGYEAVNGTGTHAYAALPFNIEPAS